MGEEIGFVENCKRSLQERWEAINKIEEYEKPKRSMPAVAFRTFIKDCLSSVTKTYHYVLPTQLLAKSVDHSLDCRSLQASYGEEGAFDARTIAHLVIVPFDQANYNVLGGSPEPYVNNPLRCPSITSEFRGKQKNKLDWDKLVKILDYVQHKNDQSVTKCFLDEVLLQISDLLENVRVLYPTPNRISLEKMNYIIETFVRQKSGGDRVEAIATALFRTIGHRFHLFDDIKRSKINAADASSGMTGDIECWKDEIIELLVEVKDQVLTFRQIGTTLDAARSEKIREIIFVAQKGLNAREEEAVSQKVEQEFTSGQNIYIVELLDFLSNISILFGEKGRVQFISEIGAELDRVNSAIGHRKAWADLLRNV